MWRHASNYRRKGDVISKPNSQSHHKRKNIGRGSSVVIKGIVTFNENEMMQRAHYEQHGKRGDRENVHIRTVHECAKQTRQETSQGWADRQQEREIY